MNAVVGAALPVFGLIVVGWLAGRTRLLDGGATDSLNRFAIYLALPALLFTVMAKADPAAIAQGRLAAAWAIGVAVPFGAAFWLARSRGRRVAEAGIWGLDAGYANAGFMGIPLCLLVFGEAAGPAIILTVLLTATVLFLFAVVLIESDLRGGGSAWQTLRRVGPSVLRNPLLLAPLAGLAVALTGWPLPAPLDRFATLLGAAASPVALVCIGLFLSQERMGGDVGPVAALVALKLVGQPLVTAICVFGIFDVPAVPAKVAVIAAALPTGTGPFTLAKLHGFEAQVTSTAILASHVVSVVTVSALVAWLA